MDNKNYNKNIEMASVVNDDVNNDDNDSFEDINKYLENEGYISSFILESLNTIAQFDDVKTIKDYELQVIREYSTFGKTLNDNGVPKSLQEYSLKFEQKDG